MERNNILERSYTPKINTSRNKKRKNLHYNREHPEKERTIYFYYKSTLLSIRILSGFCKDSPASSMPETFIQIRIAGYDHKCLLDTGCDYSLIPRRLVPSAKLDPVDLDIYVANGKPINILGHLTVEFFIQGMSVHADLLVTDDIYEFMLGYNWLAAEGVHWFFDRRILVFRGREIPLHFLTSSKVSVSRVLARERVP